MTWGYVAVTAVSVGSAALQQSSASKTAAGGVDAQNKQIAKQNKAIVQANVENNIRTGYRVGLLNMQQGQIRKQFVQQGFDRKAAAQQLLSADSANAAASGTIGASVDAVHNEITQKLGEAEAQASEAWDLQLTNFNTQLKAITDEGKDTLTHAGGEILKSSLSESDMWGNVAAAGIGAFASQYASRNMSLGLGSPSQSSTAPANISRGGSFSPSN